ncbi:hypothetical protein [Sulfitobacter sp. EhC04]|uniref:hypothetical protein n=1 Tax=Sulfitobacter sp. EhC04 TaxID=1849168 RepID=UPI0010FE7CED|nr:hypothetical protein [Sulfitobacter sp. EhC04]
MMALVISAPLQLERKLAQFARVEKGDVVSTYPSLPEKKRSPEAAFDVVLIAGEDQAASAC